MSRIARHTFNMNANRNGDCQDELSEKYKEYIESHRDTFEAKCQQLTDCIDKLLEDENVLLLLRGNNLSLNRTCGLIYREDSYENIQAGKCAIEDREDIREDLEQHLILQFEDVETSGWRNLKKCLSNNYGDKESITNVDKICGLAQKQPQICNSTNIHKTVKNFFNNQIQHLRCVCRSLNHTGDSNSHSSVPEIIGGVAGGLLLLFIICALSFFCYRKWKSRQSKKRAPNVIYLPAPNTDNLPVYQEIFDDKAYQSYGIASSGNPPNLPVRYSPNPTTRHEDEPAYLEPVEAGLKYRPKLPFPGKSNPNYGSPPEYSEVDTDDRNQDVDKSDAENGYFQPQPTPPEENGFNRSSAENTAPAYETVEIKQPGAKPEITPRATVPARRPKNDRQGESGYFLLDHDGNIKRASSAV